MLRLNLQFFGGRGAGSDIVNRDQDNPSVEVLESTDVWSFRHRKNNEQFVDDINTAARTLEREFPGFMREVERVNAVVLGKGKRRVLGFYALDDKSVNMNINYLNADKMNGVMDAAAKSKFHPSRGRKSGTEAVALHEFGHALTDFAAQKGWGRDLDDAANYIVNNAYSSSKRITDSASVTSSKVAAWTKTISGYAGKNNAEAVAEAVADYYCNGSKAKAASKSIVSELKRVTSNEPLPFN